MYLYDDISKQSIVFKVIFFANWSANHLWIEHSGHMTPGNSAKNSHIGILVISDSKNAYYVRVHLQAQ